METIKLHAVLHLKVREDELIEYYYACIFAEHILRVWWSADKALMFVEANGARKESGSEYSSKNLK